MVKTKLTKNDGKEIEHNGTGGVTLTHIHWDGTNQGHIQIEWQVSSKEELLTIATEFLGWIDHVAPNGGIVENAIKDWAERTGKLEGQGVRLKYKSADNPDAKVDLG